MEQLTFIATAIVGLILSVLNTGAQNAKRTVNRWASELLQTGKINSRETSELGTIYSNPLRDWFLEIGRDHRFQILRSQKIREKIREYKRLKHLRNIFLYTFIGFAAVSFYLFANNL